MSKLGFAKYWMVTAFAIAAAIGSPAQSYQGETIDELPSFGPLVQGLDGNFYGTAWMTETCADCGEVYRATSGGAVNDIHEFCPPGGCSEGAGQLPQAGLTLGPRGNFYGTTTSGGALTGGTVFELTPEGELTTLYAFCGTYNCAAGSFPTGGLVLGRNGNFYGTTQYGGVYTYCVAGCGTVFEITPQGKLMTLYRFGSASGAPDGANPNTTLVQAVDGNLYGTTFSGGNGAGVIFRISPLGQVSTFYTFNEEAQGANPNNLIEAADGSLYGTTQYGGVTGGGTIFRVTLGGRLTVLTTLCEQSPSCVFGPPAGLIQASDGNFYGVADAGGMYGNGAVFRMTPHGDVTPLYSFCATTCDRSRPIAPLIQGTNGVLYGTKDGISPNDVGTLFSLSLGLPAFVQPTPNFGKIGQTIGILGNDLSSATQVTFNGVAASFVAKSDSFIEATVPSGASTGKVQVLEAGKTLSSNASFLVLP